MTQWTLSPRLLQRPERACRLRPGAQHSSAHYGRTRPPTARHDRTQNPRRLARLKARGLRNLLLVTRTPESLLFRPRTAVSLSCVSVVTGRQERYPLWRVLELEPLGPTGRTWHMRGTSWGLFENFRELLLGSTGETCSPLTTSGELNWFMTWMFLSLNHQRFD